MNLQWHSCNDDLALINQCLRQGQILRATRLLTQRLRLNPRCAQTAGLLGVVFFLVKDFGYAEHLLRRSLQLDPVQPPTLVMLALVLRRTGRRAEANEWLRRALQLAEPDVAPRVRLVMAGRELRCFARAYGQHRRHIWS